MLDLLRGSARVPVSPLRKLREASGLSQGECAKIAGISPSRLSLAEHGFVNLTARQETAVRSHIIKVSKERFGQVLTEADPAFEKAVELIGRIRAPSSSTRRYRNRDARRLKARTS